MQISIQTIPHQQHRYETVGDWYSDKATGRVYILVSEMGNWRYELLVAVHELVEAFLCLQDGVTEESVDEFDKVYTNPDEEPGDSPNAPYQKQHCLATGIERILAACLGVKWSEYENAIERLSPGERGKENARPES